MFSKKSYALILFIVLLAVVYFMQSQNKKDVIFSLHRDTVVEAVYGLGLVKTDKRFEVKIGVVSTVKELFVKEGDVVEQGSVLLTLDGIPSFKAPFSGTVTSILHQKGETVFPQAMILRLEDLTDTYVEVSLEQNSVLKIDRGMTALLGFEQNIGEQSEARVSSVFSRNGEFVVRIESDNFPPKILPGMSVDVSFVVGRRENALLVPLDALEGNQVLRLRNGKKELITISTGHKDHRFAEVRDGDLLESDQVVSQR